MTRNLGPEQIKKLFFTVSWRWAGLRRMCRGEPYHHLLGAERACPPEDGWKWH